MVEWSAFVITVIAVICNAFVLLPWNTLFGILSCVLWCIYAYQEQLLAVFWINVLMGAIYLVGYIGYLLV